MKFLDLFETANVLYHISPSDNRASILQHGLNWRLSPIKSRLPTTGDSVRWKRGQYLFRDYPTGVANDDMDIYQVDVTGLSVEPDPYSKGDLARGQLVVYSPIPPERIKLVEPSVWVPL